MSKFPGKVPMTMRSTSDSVLSDPPGKPTHRRRLWWGIGGAVAIFGIAALIWFFAGYKFWTDGNTIRVADRDANLRHVLWTRPLALEGFSSAEQVYEPSVSPDGTELYFVRGKAGKDARIYFSARHNNAWSQAVPVDAVNNEFDSLGPRVTPDGRCLLFYSNRPGGFGGYDIWAAPRTDRGWGKPFNLGPQVNSEFNEFNPDPTPDGKHLIFATNRRAARREQNEAWRSTIRETVSVDYDLWIADVDPVATLALKPTTRPGTDGSLSAPTEIPATRPATNPSTQPIIPESRTALLAFHPAREIPGINTPYTEGASCMSPAGDFLYFASNRPGGQGKFDIYRSRIHADQFGPAENVGAPINSPENEADPAMAYNGFRMIFSSDRPGADGRYRLLVTDSCEVYPERQAHALPVLGWSWWLLLASALVLVPLLMFMRGWEDNRFSILQKCLLLSLLVHALITFILSFVVVTQQMTQYVKKEMQMEVAVNVTQDQGLEESLSIRGQVSGDLPVSSAPPAMAAPQRPATPDAMQQPIATAVDVPGVKFAPGGMTIPVDSPKVNTPVPQASTPAVAPASPTANSAAVDLKLPAMHAFSQAEAVPQARATEPQVSKAAAGLLRLPTASVVATNTLPSAKPSAAKLTDVSLAPTAHVEISVAPEMVKTPAPAPMAGNLNVQGPRDTGAKLTQAESTVQSALDATPAIAKAPADSSAGNLPSQAVLSTGVPKAAVKGGSVRALAATHGPAGALAVAGAGQPQPGDVAGLIAGPQVNVHASGVRAQATEPIVAVSRLDAGPATRPIETASQTMSSTSSPQLDIGTGPAGAPSSMPTAKIAVEVPAGKVGFAPTVASNIALIVDATSQIASPKLPGEVTGGVKSTTGRLSQQPESSALAGAGADSVPTAPRIKSSGAGEAGGPALLNEAKTPVATAGGASQISGPNIAARVAAPAIPSNTGGPTGAVAADIAAPQVGGPRMDLPGGKKIARLPGTEKAVGTESVAVQLQRMKINGLPGSADSVNLDRSPVAAMARTASSKEPGADLGPVKLNHNELASAADLTPDVSLSPLGGPLGPGNLLAPDSPFMRGPQERKILLKKLGGTQKSEDAVDMGLAYLARMQLPDGRWTRIEDDRIDPRRPKVPHDMACTGFAVLAFLAHDHTPDKPGPYRQVVARAIDYLMSEQDDNGDLRGPSNLRGGGSDSGNMYDQGIATYALAECAIMTRDPRVIEAATRGARFIVAAQDRNSGGWRYTPGEQGDSSVFGWQVMALHSAEQIGFEIPAETLDGAKRYLQISEEGRHHLLGGYQPHTGPTPPMTAELLFCRMLLGMPLSESGMREATQFLARERPDPGNADIYYWYYASLSMLNMQDPLWKDWNVLTRESLIKMQQKHGPSRGCWTTNMKWGDRGGRVFTTAMATLTLEVYYRYLPLRKPAE
jgi:hypothetical protein